MVEVNIRPALQEDAADLARLDNVASHGFTQWYWQKTARALGAGDPEKLAQQAMADPTYRSGWKQASVAVTAGDDAEVVGGVNGYVVIDDEELHSPSSEPVFEPIRQLFESVAGDWLVDWLAVYQHWQGRGIGARLLDTCLQRAKGKAGQASIVVEDSNMPAMALYHSRGFRQRDQRAFIPFNKTSRTQNWLLLSAPVT
ncbi:MAG: GNAT family N-acetyltransferase [Rhizobiaceae bacterium]|nr:GNAT family N-acetyltransferase [Rhizobiaceae bacterium]